MDEFINNWIVPPEAQSHAAAYITIGFLALMITAVSKGGFGGGVGVISIPLMLQVAPYWFVNGLWLPVLISCDLATIRKYPKEWSPTAFFKLAPGMLLGTAFATWLLRYVDTSGSSASFKQQEAWLKFGVGLIAIVFVLLQLWKRQEKETPWTPSWLIAIPVGAVAGITTMFAHAAGAIITMFLLPQKLEPRVFVGTTGRFFFIFNTLKLPFFIWGTSMMTLETFRYGLWMMAIGPLGVWFGSWLIRRIKPTWFVRLMYLFLIIAAGKLAYDWWVVLFPAHVS
ncbi:MAG: sulfite exporter TauE/SafE family protein [Planctomycetes bacterium]|nr:sulfite exporter TauE/SafE family protein [Planctomycetota bacterium]